MAHNLWPRAQIVGRSTVRDLFYIAVTSWHVGRRHLHLAHPRKPDARQLPVADWAVFRFRSPRRHRPRHHNCTQQPGRAADHSGGVIPAPSPPEHPELVEGSKDGQYPHSDRICCWHSRRARRHRLQRVSVSAFGSYLLLARSIKIKCVIATTYFTERLVGIFRLSICKKDTQNFRIRLNVLF